MNPIARLLFGNPPEGGFDITKLGGYTLGGTVDLGWSMDRALDWAFLPNLPTDVPFDIKDWARRKTSDTYNLGSLLPRIVAENVLYREVYSAIGAQVYKSKSSFWTWWIIKNLGNGYVMSRTIKGLGGHKS